MTREELDFIGSMNMCDEISNEAYKKIVCHCEEQEPCPDAINRQVVLEVLKDKWNAFSDANDAMQESIDTIEVLPPVKPQYTENEIQKMQDLEQAEIEKAYDLGKAEGQECEDAISRQAALEAIDAKAWEFCDYLISKNRNDEQEPVSHFADNLRECVSEELPSVNPQPKTGHWIEHERNGIAHIECSECSSWFLKSHLLRNSYCPNCGAKMVEPQERSEKE